MELWEHLQNLFIEVYSIDLKVEASTCLLGNVKGPNKKIVTIYETLCSQVKYYIHANKCKGKIVDVVELSQHIRNHMRNLEKLVARQCNKVPNFTRKWGRFTDW